MKEISLTAAEMSRLIGGVVLFVSLLVAIAWPTFQDWGLRYTLETFGIVLGAVAVVIAAVLLVISAFIPLW